MSIFAGLQSSQWDDITDLLVKNCKALSIGEMVQSSDFNMFNAMHAIELMDPKLDPGMNMKQEKMTLEKAMKEGIVKKIISHEEILAIMDSLLSLEVSVLDGYNIATTVFTSMYLQNMKSTQELLSVSVPDDVINKEEWKNVMMNVMITFCESLLKCCLLCREIILKGDIYEEEDFSSGTIPSSFVIPDDSIDKIVSNLDELARKVNEIASPSTKIVCNAICSRLNFRRNYLFALKHIFTSNGDSLKNLSIAATSLKAAKTELNSWVVIENGMCSLDIATCVAPGFIPESVRSHIPQAPRAVRLFTRREAVFAMIQTFEQIERVLSIHVPGIITSASPCETFEDVLNFVRSFSQFQTSLHPIAQQQQLCLYLTCPSNDVAVEKSAQASCFYPFPVPYSSFSKTLAGKSVAKDGCHYINSAELSIFSSLSPQLVASSSTVSILSTSPSIIPRSILATELGVPSKANVDKDKFIGRLDCVTSLLKKTLTRFSVPFSIWEKLEKFNKQERLVLDKLKTENKTEDEDDSTEFEYMNQLLTKLGTAVLFLIRSLCYNHVRHPQVVDKLLDDWNVLQADAQFVDSLYIQLLGRALNVDISTALELPVTSDKVAVYSHPFSSLVFEFTMVLIHCFISNGFISALYSPSELVYSYWYYEYLCDVRLTNRKFASQLRTWHTKPVEVAVVKKKGGSKSKKQDNSSAPSVSTVDLPPYDWLILRENASLVGGEGLESIYLALVEVTRFLARGVYRSFQWLSNLPIKSNKYKTGDEDMAIRCFNHRFSTFNKVSQPSKLPLEKYFSENKLPMNQEREKLCFDEASQCFKAAKIRLEHIINLKKPVPLFWGQYCKTLLRICVGNSVMLMSVDKSRSELENSKVLVDWSTSALFPIISVKLID